jgi:hypothetical protein
MTLFDGGKGGKEVAIRKNKGPLSEIFYRIATSFPL